MMAMARRQWQSSGRAWRWLQLVGARDHARIHGGNGEELTPKLRGSSVATGRSWRQRIERRSAAAVVGEDGCGIGVVVPRCNPARVDEVVDNGGTLGHPTVARGGSRPRG